MSNYINLKDKNITNTSLIFFILGSYIAGFIFNENSAGGGTIAELNHHWENFQLFLNNDFLTAIELTKGGKDSLGMDYDSSRTPLLSIIQAFFLSFFNVSNEFNPEKLTYFKIISFIFSLFVPFVFFLCLKKKYNRTPDLILLLLSFSILLLSPYFRTSAFWGFAENYTFLTLLLSYYFLYEIISSEKNNKIDQLKTKIFCITFFSSLCVYFDVKAIIVPILCFLLIINSNISLKNKLFSVFYFFIFSLPFFYLYNLWDGPIPPVQIEGRDAGSKIFLENIGYSISIISFYVLPLLFFKFKSVQEFKSFFAKRRVYLFLFTATLYLVLLNLFFDFNSQIILGKGFLHKIIEILINDITLKIILTNISFFICILILFLFFDKKLDYLIVLFFVILSAFSSWLFQEYFDPIILLLAFTFVSTKLFINIKNTLFLFAYQSIFLVSAILYYN